MPSEQQRVRPILFFRIISLPICVISLKCSPGAADSIYLPENNETKIPDRDSLLALCAKVGYEAIADQMQRYYEEAIDGIPEDADRHAEFLRMRETVERIGGCILRRELEYGEAIAFLTTHLRSVIRK